MFATLTSEPRPERKHRKSSGGGDGDRKPAVYRFAGFTLDTVRRELSQDGLGVIELRPKALELLRLFVENAGAVLERDRITQAIWPDAIVEDNGITQCIRDIRRALQDETHIMVRTVPGRGYVLTADVTETAGLRPSGSNPGGTLPMPEKPSLVVLPFRNMSNDPEQDHFADGMVEDITTELSRIRSLFVISRSTAFTYKDRVVDVRQISRELGVRYVLEGSVRKVGQRLRVTGQLIDAIGGSHVWAHRYDRDVSDIFAVQDEITASVAGAIEPALADAEQQRVLRKPPKSLDAWEAYQRGVWHFNKFSAEDSQSALGFFRQAIERDPNFAPGHYGTALALQWDVWYFSQTPFLEVQGTARDEALLAVSLDDKDAMAHAVLAHIRMWNGEWEDAIRQARTAFALSPNSAFVLSMLGCVLGFGGYRDEGIDRLRQAMRASPHDPLTWRWMRWHAFLEFHSHRFEAALDLLTDSLRIRPEYGHHHTWVAGSLAFLGRRDEARAVLRSAGPGAQDPRWRERPPWLLPEDYSLWQEGLRLAAGESA